MQLCLIFDAFYKWEDRVDWGGSLLAWKVTAWACLFVNWHGGLLSICHIRLQRNAIVHVGSVWNEELILKKIKRGIIARLECEEKYKNSYLNIWLIGAIFLVSSFGLPWLISVFSSLSFALIGLFWRVLPWFVGVPFDSFSWLIISPRLWPHSNQLPF